MYIYILVVLRTYQHLCSICVLASEVSSTQKFEHDIWRKQKRIKKVYRPEKPCWLLPAFIP